MLHPDHSKPLKMSETFLVSANRSWTERGCDRQAFMCETHREHYPVPLPLLSKWILCVFVEGTLIICVHVKSSFAAVPLVMAADKCGIKLISDELVVHKFTDTFPCSHVAWTVQEEWIFSSHWPKICHFLWLANFQWANKRRRIAAIRERW